MLLIFAQHTTLGLLKSNAGFGLESPAVTCLCDSGGSCVQHSWAIFHTSLRSLEECVGRGMDGVSTRNSLWDVGIGHTPALVKFTPKDHTAQMRILESSKRMSIAKKKKSGRGRQKGNRRGCESKVHTNIIDCVYFKINIFTTNSERIKGIKQESWGKGTRGNVPSCWFWALLSLHDWKK